jgi:hypothetical protein
MKQYIAVLLRASAGKPDDNSDVANDDLFANYQRRLFANSSGENALQ